MPLEPQPIDQQRQAYIDASGDGFWDWYIQRDYEYMSPRFWEMFGYLPHEKAHSPSAWMDMIFPDDLALAQANLQKHIDSRGEYAYEQEVRYRHKNGSTVVVLCRGKVVEWGGNGEALRMLGTHTDITRQKRAEAELAEVKERYDLAVRGSAVGLWDWNIESGSLYWSERFKGMLGIEDKTLVPSFDLFTELVHPADTASVVAALNAHLQERVPYEIEFRIQRQDKEYIWVKARGQALWNSHGQPVRMAGSVDDVTVVKNNALTLQKNLDFQKLVMNSNSDLFFVKDEKFRIIEANAAFLSLYPEELRDGVIGTTTLEKYDADQAEEFLKEDRKAFAEGLSEVIETIDFPDGNQRTLLTRKTRFEDVSGQPFILGVARDITELKRAESRLIQLNEQLEEFAYRTSHDLRSPLISSSKLLSMMEAAMAQGEYDKCLRYLPVVRDAINSMESLVNDILTLSRVDHGEEVSEPVDFKQVFDASLAKFSHLDGFTDVKIYFSDHYQKVIYAQKLRITLVLENLLTNAIKYRDINKSQAFVKVEVEEVERFWQLTVSDNGMGIPERYKQDVFAMFKRFHSGVAFGSGLGLYMVKKSVEKMCGYVDYIDTKEGSQFVVRLPMARLRGAGA